ncbi:uncharacterized protein LTHEOB_12989 [Lasiodiplodia theobromae]|uniref:uncharacterized protein n=1 Tax=Lasiodiplodia theobromae TaxID=45133 RepID=UPI0015C39E8A|nr:uncharacterized protein LTHEOB_12989 [Lasiodiplodia theobromae]KAF4534196.1 hypothetical protein LTHEOB_12989 [Lasiodiplodia theobromae]
MTPDKYYWNNIHDDLKGFINDGDQSRIAEVSLGQNNYFFARKENGAWKYLVKRDSELHKLLQARANDIARVSLSPDSDHCFVVFKTGSCRFWVPKSWESKIWEVVRKAGISLDHSSTSGYSSGTNTNYRSNAVIGRQDPKKTFGSLQESETGV